MHRWLVLFALAGCDQLFGLSEVKLPDALPMPDFVPFVGLAPLPGAVNTGLEEDDPSLTADLLELYLLRASDLYVARRATTSDPWPMATPIVELNTIDTELRPCISGDGLTLYFSRAVGGQRDVFVTTRATRADAWAPPVLVALDLNQPTTHEHPGWASSDGLKLLVETFPVPDGDNELYLATRTSPAEPFTSVPLEGINYVSDDGGGWATDNGKTIVFESNRAGSMDIWEAISVGATWAVQAHPELNSETIYMTDGTPWLSGDGTVIVFSSSRTGNDDLYMATR